MATRRLNPATIIKNQKEALAELEDERDELAEENDILRARLQRVASLVDTSDIDNQDDEDFSDDDEE